ncbi:bifunctional UDP-4-keto-pentose/UDP-xylose synthase [Acetobacteraceae bacterium]|nr:bifunctional UDP-4-keto-pentose/UDP-xylose synthase [Candidatus Parcubacteria bacterium]
MRKGKTVLVFGANGFIGQHLVHRLLKEKGWYVIANDLRDNAIRKYNNNPRFEFHKGTIFNKKLIQKLVARADIVVPLAGIATPKTYISNPLHVYEVDFEANLEIVRECVKRKKRVIWPSTSEVYGMSTDDEFHPETSHLVMGPINKMRWIYAAGKQLADRVVYAYGRDRGLDFTIFRPFNWIGYGQDNIHDTSGTSRLITQFLGNILRGEDLRLVDGGDNRRSFTYIDDCIDALMKIIENKNGIASGRIYNIGNPKNNKSIREVATTMLKLAPKHHHFRENAKKVRIVHTTPDKHYGEGYQDMINRKPHIRTTQRELNWNPKIDLRESLKRIFEAYVEELNQTHPPKKPVRKASKR